MGKNFGAKMRSRPLFERVNAGDSLNNLSAKGYNAALDVAEAYASGGLDALSTPQRLKSTPYVAVSVVNRTGEDLPPLSIVGINNPIFQTASTNANQLDTLSANGSFLSAAVFDAVKPRVLNHFYRFGVIAAGLRKNEIARAVIRGAVKARLKVNAGDEFLSTAGIIDASTDDEGNTTDSTYGLVAHPGGPVHVLWSSNDADAGGYKLADLLIDNPTPGWHLFQNQHPEPAPPYAILELDNIELAELEDIDNKKVLTYKTERARRNNAKQYAVNGSTAVESDGYGMCTFNDLVWVRVKDNLEFEAGDNAGPVKDDWHIAFEDGDDESSFGFEFLGPKAESDSGIDIRALCRRIHPIEVAGVADEDIAADSSGKVKLYRGANVTSPARFITAHLTHMHSNETIKKDKEVLCRWQYDRERSESEPFKYYYQWLIVGAECP